MCNLHKRQLGNAEEEWEPSNQDLLHHFPK
jgi:hypothetical protein